MKPSNYFPDSSAQLPRDTLPRNTPQGLGSPSISMPRLRETPYNLLIFPALWVGFILSCPEGRASPMAYIRQYDTGSDLSDVGYYFPGEYPCGICDLSIRSLSSKLSTNEHTYIIEHNYQTLLHSKIEQYSFNNEEISYFLTPPGDTHIRQHYQHNFIRSRNTSALFKNQHPTPWFPPVTARGHHQSSGILQRRQHAVARLPRTTAQDPSRA